MIDRCGGEFITIIVAFDAVIVHRRGWIAMIFVTNNAILSGQLDTSSEQ